MAHASTSSRNLSLTEELEKLEQSITLTLQEIDHNFSRAHRIVTTSILPIVDQYAEHSKAVWEGSKFWKQFFEASANVSLSGYEELTADEEETALSQSQGNRSSYANSSSQPGGNTTHTDSEDHETYDHADSLLDNGDISGSTPRPTRPKGTTNGEPTFADYPSPYEALKRELKGGNPGIDTEEDPTQLAPTTPGPEHRLPDMSMTPASSPFAPKSYLPSTTQKKGENLLLHRVLDKNYRLQATPHKTRKEVKASVTRVSLRDTTSPMSSSPIAVPQLRSEIFSSPVRQQHSRPAAARTPGMSVQTPVKGKANETGGRLVRDEITWESDSDQDAEDIYKELGMSPPKTIQFVLAPSRLLQTPAREASKRIVEDLLMTAGAGHDTEEEDSPSMVKMQGSILDDSF